MSNQKEEYKSNGYTSQNSKVAEDSDYIDKFSNLNLDTNKRWLYMDGLNYGWKFFEQNGNYWQILDGVQNIKDFVRVAQASGWKIKVFIDATVKSEEFLAEWKKRREDEVTYGVRGLPQGLNSFVGDAFRENGCEVLYSFEKDKDDTLAAYAMRDGAAILSGDRDYFLYEDLSEVCPIYKDYEVVDSELVLLPSEESNRIRDKPKRKIPSSIPKVVHRDPGMTGLMNMYLRGSPSPLTKLLGNPHVTVRALRRALCARKGITGRVKEMFPIWKNGQVGWLIEDVTADSSLDYLLDYPNEAFERFFPRQNLVKPEGVSLLDWQNHLFAIQVVIYELCRCAKNDETSLLEMFRPVIEEFKARNGLAPKGEPFVEPPAYRAKCKDCKDWIELTRRKMNYFKEQGWKMPIRCKPCQEQNKQNRRRY